MSPLLVLPLIEAPFKVPFLSVSSLHLAGVLHLGSAVRIPRAEVVDPGHGEEAQERAHRGVGAESQMLADGSNEPYTLNLRTCEEWNPDAAQKMIEPEAIHNQAWMQQCKRCLIKLKSLLRI